MPTAQISNIQNKINFGWNITAVKLPSSNVKIAVMIMNHTHLFSFLYLNPRVREINQEARTRLRTKSHYQRILIPIHGQPQPARLG